MSALDGELRYKPGGIVVDIPNQLLQINWRDGHTSVYELTFLRRMCPCAECRPWVHGGPRETPERVRQAVGRLEAMRDVQPVGSYALSFNWTDGHTTGIYDYRYLRSICPCPEHAGPTSQQTDNEL